MQRLFTALAFIGVGLLVAAPASAQDSGRILTGQQAYGGFRDAAPGVRRKITPADMPAPYATRPVAASPRTIDRPEHAIPKAPQGFTVELVTSGLDAPRAMRVAPNGDLFVAETSAGRLLVLRAQGAGFGKPQVFASGLSGVFGIAFAPHRLYVATTTEVLRFPYEPGDTRPRGRADVIVKGLPSGGHSTRDLAFSPDGKTLFVSVGSRSNYGDDMGAPPHGSAATSGTSRPPGAAWGPERDRADVLAFNPDGSDKRIYATGLRNCAGLTLAPSGDLWCAVNERDMLGDNLPPDYATRVKEGHFYGWPWFYIGDHRDPRLHDVPPGLADKVTIPDVLIQPHSAPLQIVFYEGKQFPASYRGSAFVTLHGSWNRAPRTGYKVIRLEMKDGKPTGVYEDFLTGFVEKDGKVWGRPVGIAVAKDGALLIGEDASGTIWRVSAQK